MNNFANWLRDEMAARHWSQSELARRSGLSQSMISLMALGRNQPGVETLQCLSRAFGIRREDIFRGAGWLDPLPDQDDPALGELQYLIPRLSRPARAKVLDYARFVDQRAPLPLARESGAVYSADDACELFQRLSPEKQKPVLELLKLLAES